MNLPDLTQSPREHRAASEANRSRRVSREGAKGGEGSSRSATVSTFPVGASLADARIGHEQPNQLSILESVERRRCSRASARDTPTKALLRETLLRLAERLIPTSR